MCQRVSGSRLVPVLMVVCMAGAGLIAPVMAGNSGTSLKGSARTARHRPVVGASVVILSNDFPGVILLTSTDGKGSMKTMNLPDGTYDVAISKDGLAQVVKENIQVKFPFRPVVEIDMTPELEEQPSGDRAEEKDLVQQHVVQLTGEVKNLEGQAIPDVSVALVRVGGDENPVRVRSGEDGRFEWPELPSGEWRVEVRGVGFLPIRATVNFAQSVELISLLVPQPAGHKLQALDLLPEEIPVYPGGDPGSLTLADSEEPAPGADLVSGDGG